MSTCVRISALFAIVAGVAVGCVEQGEGDDLAPAEWTPGKGDGVFELVEAGGVEYGATTEINLGGRVPAYRVVSFGDTELTIDAMVRNGSNPYVIVEGPLANADAVAVGQGTVVDEDDDAGRGRDAKLTVRLGAPGVYRVLVGTRDSLARGLPAKGKVGLKIACARNCERPALSQSAFIAALGPRRDAFVAQADAQIAAIVPDPAMAAALKAQLHSAITNPTQANLARFPTISLAALGSARPLLGGLPEVASQAGVVVDGELRSLLGPCKPTREMPKPRDARVPEIREGHFPNFTLSPCQAAHAKTFAQALTSLAENNGSRVTYRGASVTTPEQLFAALLANGHKIEVRNERTYADFLAFATDDKDVIWPVWLDTGIPLSSGENLVIPMGHSHHAWRITGPDVNTRIMFYLGIGGTGFFGQTGQRPAWTGWKITDATTVSNATSAEGKHVLATVAAATAYLQRNRVERTTVARGMRADGYGYVGVCMDSNATIEYLTKGTVSTFPLLRAKALDAQPDVGDGLDAALRTLPKDGDGLPDKKDALRRALAVQPLVPAAIRTWDAALATQIELAQRDAGQ